MALIEAALPYSTPYDPAEDPPGSIDPLGTQAASERLAELLLPGLTARMWRARLLTVTTLISWLAERFEERGPAHTWLEYRLALERFFVTALAHRHAADEAGWERAVTNVPGRMVVKRALLAGEPVTQRNFLKGPVVNAPFGVMATLARNLELLDLEDLPGPVAHRLIAAWENEEGVAGLLDEGDREGATGHDWFGKVYRAITRNLDDQKWPSPGNEIWNYLADHLRPDRMGPGERAILLDRLRAHPVRTAVLERLVTLAPLFEQSRWRGRLAAERAVIREGLLTLEPVGPVETSIRRFAEATDAFLTVGELLYQAFDALRWGLTRSGGGNTRETLISLPPVAALLDHTRAALASEVPRLGQAIDALREESAVVERRLLESLDEIRRDALAGLNSNQDLAAQLLARHERVSRAKDRAPWIEGGATWTVVPGYGLSADEPPRYGESYIHPTRVANALSLLRDLGEVTAESVDEQAE